MIREGVYNLLGIIVCPLHMCRGHTMNSWGV